MKKNYLAWFLTTNTEGLTVPNTGFTLDLANFSTLWGTRKLPSFKSTLFSLVLSFASPTLNAQTCKPHSIPATTPVSRFTINADGTVLDKNTRLMWKRCSEGQSGTDCRTGSPITRTWQGALQQAQTVNIKGFAGFKDWRLPNLQELRALVEEQCYNPAINATVFPNTLSDYFYLSSSPVAGNSYDVWSVSFGYGSDYQDDMDYGYYYVRLVRSGQ